MADELEQGTGRGIAGEEEARRRIARELHDDHCQRLAAVSFELKAVRRQLAEGDPRRTELDAVDVSLAELGNDLHRLSHNLHPAILEHRGLAEALRDACAEVERRHGLKVHLSLLDGGRALPPDVELGLYRIAQEALANVTRHAGARSVHVTLGIASRKAHLTVADDGAGFAPEATRRSGGGLGLATMKERVDLLGGWYRLTSAPGAGTEVQVIVPLYELGRLLRRHRRPVAAAALVILALAAGLTATVFEARRAEREAAGAEAVAQFLEGLFKASDPRQARGEVPDARELLRRGTGRVGEELRGQPLQRARLLDTLGGIHTELGLYDEARPLLEEALEIRERLAGKDSPKVADTLVRLGAVAHLSGKGDPLPFFRRALVIRESRLGPEDPAVASVLNNLGTAFAKLGRFDEAEATLRRTLALQQRLWGDRDPRVAKTLHNLGGIAYYRDRLDDAERLLKRGLAIREAVLPADDLDLAGSREALALLLSKRGRPAEAAEVLERLAASGEKVYGPAHPSFARTLLNLGLARKSLGQDEPARRNLERALAICDRSLGPGDTLGIRALATLAELHLQHGRTAEAEPLYRRLVALGAPEPRVEERDQALAKWEQLLRSTGRETEAAEVETQAAAAR